jgi:predicted metal-dependent hydrolase
VHFALPVIDYVVAHELAHLREMNHSPAFWDVVRTAVPDFQSARGALRHEVLPAFD